MASVSFFTEEGEKIYRLSPHRTFRIGRDPGNDAILRDAKVSRRHAEIVFERGFFVLHDLASSNGSYVNEKKIRVAPLTDGALLRLGNSRGVFSEELATDEPPVDEVRKTVPDAAHAEHQKTAAHEKETSPVDPPLPTKDPASETPPYGEEIEDISILSAVDAPPQQRIEGMPIRAEPPARKMPWSELDPRLRLGSYIIESPLAYSPTRSVRDSDGNVLFHLTRPSRAVAIVARLVAFMIVLTGLAVAIFLASEKQLLFAIAGLVLTSIFFAMVLLLIPRADSELFAEDGSRQLRAVEATSHLAWRPHVELFDAEGMRLATFKRTGGSRLSVRRWEIVDRFGGAYAKVVEEPPSSAALRKAFRFIRTNDRIDIAGRRVATIVRRGTRDRRYDIDRTDTVQLDPRIAVGIVLVTEGIEGR